MTLLIFGKSGQVATELQRRMPDALFLDRTTVDLSDSDACAAAVRQHAPSAVINAAAYTAVDRAEEDEAQAMVINGDAPGEIAKACAAEHIPLVHISTDYVFDGTGERPWRPDDPVNPQNVYGRSKLAGEEAVRRAGGVHAILRTSWVFSAHGNNFVKTMLRLSETRDALDIVADQIGGPTPADALAEACIVVASALKEAPEKSGTYHFSGQPPTSWECFARETFARAGRAVLVTGIATSSYPTAALRPLNSRLDTSSLTKAFGIHAPDWRAGLDRVLAELDNAG
ncbi:dTDP-4-dehydrorhamnose reductase [Roseovarius sp. S4756]|uniref:dTDP-4-dehydrorhamnose reductase n=1 Tax=Roseovarius maritimus TaxID=3342637 RepID=UPI00372A901A